MGYSTLKAALDAVVKTNGRQEITGSNLNGVMTSILQGVDILDRANPADTSGLNHVVLKKNLTFAEQVTGTNTIYEIRDSFNLGGGSVVIPDGCLLKFNGGKLTNGGLSGNKFLVDSDSCCFSGITFLSDYVGVIHSRWFVHTDKLSKQNALVDCSTYLQDWVNCGSRNLYLDAGLYYVGSTITINRKVCIDGDGNMLTPRQEWPENYWDQSAIIFTDQEIPVVNFVIGNDGYKAFNIKNVGFANINKTPSVDTIPILKFDLTNAGLWGLDFSPCIYGSVDGSTFNHIGYQFNVYGTTFFALCHYGGKLDKLNIGYEFNKDAGATGFNNVSTFDVTATNVNMLINAPDFLNYATIRGMMQMNVNNNTFNNNKAFCEINGPVVWEADAADYGGSGTTWTARYLVRASRKITYKNAPAYAFVRNDGAPVYYNDAGDGDKSVNVIQTNSLLYLLKLDHRAHLSFPCQ